MRICSTSFPTYPLSFFYAVDIAKVWATMSTWGKASRFRRFTIAEMHSIIVRNNIAPHTIESVIFFCFSCFLCTSFTTTMHPVIASVLVWGICLMSLRMAKGMADVQYCFRSILARTVSTLSLKVLNIFVLPSSFSTVFFSKESLKPVCTQSSSWKFSVERAAK